MDRHPKDSARTPRPRQDEKRSDGSKSRGEGAKPGFKDRPGGKPGGKPGAGKPGDKAAAAPLRQERIAKVMARAGIASRREVERLIGLGKVALNGRILDTAATLVTRDDVITVDGKPIGSAQATRVWRYHKPVGLMTTHNDPAGRPTVFDSLPSTLPRVISVGRLDINSEGLLLLTNDGELSRALEMPTTGWVRQYRARARGRATQADLDRLKDGCVVDGVRYGPIEATLDKAKEGARDEERGGANLWVSVSITEGKNREVRKVLESIGLTVNRLIRLAYGPFQLGTLPLGSVEEVGPRVIRELLSEHIRPETLPTGNTVETPAPIPGRRPQGAIVKGRSGSAISDPSRKPSRVRAAEAAAEAGADAAKRPPKKVGWAKAAPRTDTRPKRPFKPREGQEGERPKRDFKPRDGAARDDRPKRDFKPRAEGPGDRPKRDFQPRGEGVASDRPKRDFKPRSNAERPSDDRPGGRPGGKPGGKPGSGPRGFGGKPGGKPGGRPAGGAPRGPRGPGGPRKG
ncbi:MULTISPECIES: pseudouridine synthase [Brevundimonas]|uniref:pseudouridine synthase n=1 Tax=Brevundimonas TaxID=41275 RepID=UPI000F0295EC|nr:pseudouridine synthase [Brevundimonas lutea]